MTEAFLCGKMTRDHAVQYRDGLMIAMLAGWPLRRGEFFALRIGHNFELEGGRYVGRVDAAVTKSKRDRPALYPKELTVWIKRYLEQVRPHLTRGNPADHWLWVRHGGKRMRKDANRLGPLTFRKFGKHVNLHLFRDCDTTTMMLEAPQHFGIIPDLLGHASPVPGRFYNQASMISAGRKYREVVHGIRELT